jgi:hypothetical protein
MEWQHFVDKAFLGIIGFIAIYAVRFLEKLTRSINELNIKIAQMLEKITEHDAEIRELKKRRG